MKAFDNALPIIVVKYRQMKLPAVSSTNRYLSVPKEMARKVRVEEPRIIALITQMRFLDKCALITHNQLGLSWHGKKTSERAIELRLRQMNFASDLVFVPTASDMELSTKMFDQKMLRLDLPNLLRKEVILTYSISQLCSELAKLERLI